MDGGAHGVDAVDGPVEAVDEGLLAALHGEGLHGIEVVARGVGIAQAHGEQHAVGQRMGLKHLGRTAEGIGREGVVAVEKGGVLPRSQRESDVAGVGLTAVLVEMADDEAPVALGVAAEDGPGTVG